MKRLLLILLLLCNTAWADGLAGLNYVAMYAGGATPTRTESGRTVFATGVSSQINYNWGTSSVMGGPSDGVIIHWTGYLKTPGTSGNIGIYFYNSSDDGFSLALNGSYVLNNWREQGQAYYNSNAGVTLAAGTVYTVDIWYYENGGGAVAQLYWNTGSGITLIPSSNFATTSTYWAPSLCCGGSSATFSASPTNVNKINAFINRSSNDSQVYIEQIGNSNTVTINQEGTKNNYTKYYDSGSYNTVTINQTGNSSTTANYTDLSLTGDSNTVSVTQQSTGGSKGAYLNIHDNNNNVTVLQKDSGSDYLNLDLSGGSKTVSVTQQGAGNHMADITLSGAGSRSLSLTQSGSTAQSYSINSSCASSCQAITVTQGQ